MCIRDSYSIQNGKFQRRRNQTTGSRVNVALFGFELVCKMCIRDSDDGGQFVFGIKSAEEARTDNHGAVGKYEGIWFGRLDDTYVQALSLIHI